MCLSNCFEKFPILKEKVVIIDGNNVAYSRFNRCGKPCLSDIILLINHLVENVGFCKENIHCITDPTLKYYIDKPEEYKVLIKEGVIIEAPKIADEIILSFALNHDFCFVISNDRFREYIKQLPSRSWLEERRISFIFINEEVCLSPNIDFEKITNNFHLKRMLPSTEITTLEILKIIEKSEGELNLF